MVAMARVDEGMVEGVRVAKVVEVVTARAMVGGPIEVVLEVVLATSPAAGPVKQGKWMPTGW